MANAQGRTNWFAIGISIAVVVVLVVLGGVVILLNKQANSPGVLPQGEIVNSETGAISYGDGPDTVAVYIDFMCPICNSFEQQFGADMQKAAGAGKITLEYHPISILDRFSQGTDYSTRSAAAMFCVAEKAPEQALSYMDMLFKKQPSENTPGLDDATLASFAKEVGADAAVPCIEEGTFMKFPLAQAKKQNIQGTPTVEINGKRLDLQAGEIQQLVDLID